MLTVEITYKDGTKETFTPSNIQWDRHGLFLLDGLGDSMGAWDTAEILEALVKVS